MNKQTSLLDNGLIWFGAGVSIAEILTGTYLAPLGLTKGILAIVLGHIIGGILFFLAGIIGGSSRKSAMDSVKMSFGKKGGLLFAILNVVQLVGWTAIMIYDGSLSAASLFHGYQALWCIVIGGLIGLWIFIGIKNLGKVNSIAMMALFVLTIVLCFTIVRQGHNTQIVETISFSAALELSISMPLSWLPVISDYTKEAKEPIKASLISALTYSLTSSWMFLIGMMAAMMTGESDIAKIMLKAGLGIAALIIIILSTVTTTFLDALSAGISFQSITSKADGRIVGLIVALIGTLCAIVFPMDDITNFLYFIGSIFTPMIAVMIVSFFFFHDHCENQDYQWMNLLIWLLGFIGYRMLMHYEFILGYTIVDLLSTGVLTYVVYKLHFMKS
ncbi:putative hydroxymethylpyrimidine transporter CytX [Sharpea azabuensis]|nr:putative hydroxymethylpyrimidine transporter CytX [Sharpea azabuensis]HBG85518.1 putative hydroxymethylpyrimidine transporter CytX [Erysipelotrichaceae bacterium]